MSNETNGRMSYWAAIFAAIIAIALGSGLSACGGREDAEFSPPEPMKALPWEGEDAFSPFLINPKLPLAPTNLRAWIVAPTQINLFWEDNAINETGYKVFRKKGSGDWVLIAKLAADVESHSVTSGIVPGKTYSFKVVAYNKSGSAKSNIALATPPPPAAPSNLTAASDSSDSIELAWADNSLDEAGFKIERKTGPAGTWAELAVVAADSVTYEDDGLSPPTVYYYRVRSYNQWAASDPSNEASSSVCIDNDGDGHGAGCAIGPDCDDGDSTVYPGAPEICDLQDNQCSGDAGYGQIDEGVKTTYYLDADGDTFGDAGNTVAACSPPGGYLTDSTDCDDADQDNWDSCLTCLDGDTDGWFDGCNLYSTRTGPDCNDANPNEWNTCLTCLDSDGDGWWVGCNVYVTVSGPDQCDYNQYAWTSGACATCLDDDSDGWVGICDDSAGYNDGNNPDCEDMDPEVYPGALELCDGIDNQCPGDPFYGAVDMGCMVPIPAGCFNMGDAFNEGDPYIELPVHNVCISAFYMDATEVTNAEYSLCVSDGGCAAPSSLGSDTRGSYFGNPIYVNFPVIFVDWDKANAYCAWAGERLPTEAEWEYAARGGLSGKRYPLGDSVSCSDANYGRWDLRVGLSYYGPCYSYGGLNNDTHQVRSYAANGYGLYDMSGNVWEWVNDWFSGTYYSESPVNDPQGPSGPGTGTGRGLRGGGWYYASTYNLRISDRKFDGYSHQYSTTIGFRCAKD